MPDQVSERLEYRDGAEDQRERREAREAERQKAGLIIGVLCVLILFALIATGVFLYFQMKGLHS